MFIHIYGYTCAYWDLHLYVLFTRIRLGTMMMRMTVAVLWMIRDAKFFCFIKRRMREYYISVLSKESLLRWFVVHRLSATGLKLAAIYLFFFYNICNIYYSFHKIENLFFGQRILETKISYLRSFTFRALQILSPSVAMQMKELHGCQWPIKIGLRCNWVS